MPTPVFDAASESGPTSGASSKTWSHTCTGSDRYLVVGVSFATTFATVTGITYNGVAMTLLKQQSATNKCELWGLAAPATGANNIIATFGSGAYLELGAMSFTGVDQLSPTEGVAGASGSGSPITVNVTTVTDNALVVDVAGTSDTMTVGAGQTERVNQIDMLHPGLAMSHEGPKTPAGSVTMSWTFATAGIPWSIAAIALKPASGVVTAPDYYLPPPVIPIFDRRFTAVPY